MRSSLIRFRNFYIYTPRTFAFSFPLTVLGVMASAVSNQIDELVIRLNEAERRAKLLNKEVKNIKQEILILKNSVHTLPSSSSSHNLRVTRKISTSPTKDATDGLPSVYKKTKVSFQKQDGYVCVYTDGACENNGKINAKAGIGVWFGNDHPLNISQPVIGKATNNTAEIQACIQALSVLESQAERKVKILTDSKFTIDCMTKWITRWKQNDWRVATGGPVKNKEDLQKLDELISRFENVIWEHVAGHKGIIGNEEADKLARKGAIRYRSN